MDEKVADLNIFASMNTAIIESAHAKVNVRKELGKELIEILDQLQYNYYLIDKAGFDKEVGNGYIALKKLLGYTLIEYSQQQIKSILLDVI